MTQYLAFLVNFMEATGQNSADLAKRVGVSKPAVSDWFKRGDMRLSTAERILKSYGCTIHFFLKKKEYERDVLMEQRARYGRFGNEIIVSLEKMNIENKKLTSLKNAIKCSGKNMKDVAASLEIAPETLTYYWNTDDCPVSAFYKIADIIGYEAFYKIEEAK